MTGVKGSPRADHRHAAEQAKQLPGQWVLAATYRSTQSAKSAARLIRTGGGTNLPFYHPAGAFEARHALTQDGADLYIRYVDPAAVAAAGFRESIEAGLTESFDSFSSRLDATADTTRRA